MRDALLNQSFEDLPLYERVSRSKRTLSQTASSLSCIADDVNLEEQAQPAKRSKSAPQMQQQDKDRLKAAARPCLSPGQFDIVLVVDTMEQTGFRRDHGKIQVLERA